MQGSVSSWMSRLDGEMNRRLISELQRAPPGGDAALSGVAAPQSHRQQGYAPRAGNDKGAAPSEADLTTSLLTRLGKLEKEWKVACHTIQRKDKAMLQLTQQFDEYRRLHRDCGNVVAPPPPPPPEPSAQQEVERLGRENARLRRQLQLAWGQVGDMKQFLTDYGMVWVGSGSNAEDAEAHVDDERVRAGVDTASRPPPPPPSFVEHPPGRARKAKATSSAAVAAATTAETAEIATMVTDGMTEDGFVADMALLAEKVDELNALAGDGKAQVVRGPSGETRLKIPDALLLVMFRDGFQLRGGPLRSYQQSSNRSFVKDLLDGYFPFELKREFPEGVPFKLVDHTHVAFDGAVQAGGSAGGSVRSLSSLTAVQTPLAAEQYLQQLPVAVIRNGQVVNVRADIEALLKAPPTPPSCSHVTTASDSTAAGDGDAEAAESTTLRVKGEDGAHTYVIKLAADATIGQLRRHLDRHRGVAAATAYEIRSTFPVQTYADDALTLRAAGLVPNAALVLRALPA